MNDLLSRLIALSYVNVHSLQGGPIDRIAITKIDSPLIGPSYEAYAYLSERNLNINDDRQNQLYGKNHGCGTSAIKTEAINKAISEALERWVFFDLRNRGNSEFGGECAQTTTGFAAFPRPYSYFARSKARAEAIERWAIRNWWAGNLPISSHFIFANDIDVYLFSLFGVQVAILHRFMPNLQLHYYGFAAAKSREKAIVKAMVELDRNRRVLLSNRDTRYIPTEYIERRLLYFASENGFETFKERVTFGSKNSTLSEPKTLIDSEIKGPWQKYAIVWRFLLDEIPVDDINREDIFFF